MRLFEEAFLTVWNGGAESDGFNRLTLFAELRVARGRRCCARSRKYLAPGGVCRSARR